MFRTSSFSKLLTPAFLAAAVLGGAGAAAPAAAGDWWGRDRVVERHMYRPPVVREVVVVRRPVRVVRKVIVVERPSRWPSYSYGWGRPRWHDDYRPHRPWRDRPRCWLPERHLCG